MNSKQYIDLENTYGAHNYHPLDIVITKGHGVWVQDVNGKKYMDFLSSYSALNQGHTHKRLVSVIKKQAAKLTLTSRAFRNDQLGPLYKQLCELSGFEMALFMNSGAEAVETALKLVRKWGYYKKGVEKDKAEIITAANNFHGRTIAIVGFSTEDQYKDGFGPFTDGFKTVPYNDAKAIEKAITKNTVAVMIEPLQGEAGILMPDEGYLEDVAKICKKHNVLFVVDEIQTGLGRTGKLFAFQHEKNVKPDVIILGKALGGGFYPISAVLSSRKIFEVIHPGDHGSTFGGNPLACALAQEALNIIVDEKLVEKSRTLGEYLLQEVGEIKSTLIKEVRGKGLFIGIELVKSSGGARKYCEQLAQEGLLCKETHEMVIRLAPPLTITKSEIDQAVKKLKKVLAS